MYLQTHGDDDKLKGHSVEFESLYFEGDFVESFKMTLYCYIFV